MAVLIEGVSIVVRIATIKVRHDGGLEDFFEWISGFRYCYDDHLVAVHFKRNDTVREILDQIKQRPMRLKNEAGSWETLAVVHQVFASALAPCEWLVVGRNSDGAVFACMKEQEQNPGSVSVPEGWQFKGSRSQKYTHRPLDMISDRFRLLRSEGLSNIYLDTRTGLEIPAGRLEASTEGAEWRARLRKPEGKEPESADKADKADSKKVPEGELIHVEMAFADQADDPDFEEGNYLEEPVRCVRVGPNRYRLDQNPKFTEMASYGDVVEGEEDEYGNFVIRRVVGKSGLKTIRTSVPRMFYFCDFGRAFLDKVMDVGGMWDIFCWGTLIFSIPEDLADEFGELYSVACREAQLLGKDERRLPSELYHERPEGGAGQTEENN